MKRKKNKGGLYAVPPLFFVLKVSYLANYPRSTFAGG
jgi:hypothetical protein